MEGKSSSLATYTGEDRNVVKPKVIIEVHATAVGPDMLEMTEPSHEQQTEPRADAQDVT